jgi:putative ABC transport system permease protein
MGSVKPRNKEFGIRLTLGATASALLPLALKDDLHIAIAALSAGLAVAAALAQLLTRFLFDVSPLHPLTFADASTLPRHTARRAMLVDPIAALHNG